MTPFTVPQPTQPRPGEVVDWNGWDIFLRHADIKMRHEAATIREAQEERAIVANAALAAANDNLAAAMREAAAMQLEAAKQPVVYGPRPAPTDAEILLEFYKAGLQSGEDGGTLTSEATAALRAYRTATARPAG